MQSIWHKAVAVNSWRAKIARGPIDASCLVFHSGQVENYVHRFILTPKPKLCGATIFLLLGSSLI